MLTTRLSADGEALSLALLQLGLSALLGTHLLILELGLLLVELLLHLAVTSVQFLLALLELLLLLLYLLLEHHLHLAFHLLELLLVQRTLLLLLGRRVDLLEHRWVGLHTKRLKLVGSVVFVEEVVGVLLELFHVCSDEHLAKLDKVAVLLVVHFDDTPRVLAAPNLAALGGAHFGVGAYNSEWDLGHDLVVLGNRLLIVVLVAWSFKDLDAVVCDVCKDLEDESVNAVSEGTKHIDSRAA